MKKYLILILTIAIGAFLRLWMLSSVPNGLTWDEAAIGYNAYSILKTGRDEFGKFLPIIFKSFGDYKPGAYIYLTVPSVAIFGLSEFAVRFPSALAGILAIWGIYLLSKEIFSHSVILSRHSDQAKRVEEPHSTNKDLTQSIKLLGFDFHLWDLTALALAVSPWHIHFSRGAWEVNVFTTFTIFAIYFFLRFLKNKSSLYPSLLFACLSLALYQAAKLLTPLIFIFLIILYWKDFWGRFNKYLKPKPILYLSPFIIFGLWIFFGSIFGSAGNRLSTLSIFNYKPGISEETKQIDNNSPLIDYFHNQPEFTAELISSRYLYHFSPEVLFYEGPVITERGHIPSLGVLHPLEIVWLLLGAVFLMKLFPQKSSLLIFGLLLIAPIPASLTLAEFSTVRSLFLTVPLAIISGLGMFYLLEKSKWVFIPIVLIYSFIAVYVFDVYFFHSQSVFAVEFNYGYKQAVQVIKDNPTKKVVFTDVYGQPYIYYLFYTAYDPATYQKNNDFISGGLDVGRVGHVGNVEFHQFGTSDLMTQKDTLFIGSEGNINNQFDITGPNVALFDQIETPDHKIIFRIIKTKP